MPPLIIGRLLLLFMTVYGFTVQPSLLHNCVEPEKNQGNITSHCNETQFLNKNNTCQKCTVFNKTEIKALTECSSVRDVVLKCKEGMYVTMEPYTNDLCKAVCSRCTLCGNGVNEFKNYEKASCTGYSDTLCCAKEDEIAENGECVDPHKTMIPHTPTSKELNQSNGANITSNASFLISHKYLFLSLIACLALLGL